MNGVSFDEIVLILQSLVENLPCPLSFRGNSSIDLRICARVAIGVQGTLRTLLAFIDGSHSHHVDDLLPRRTK